MKRSPLPPLPVRLVLLLAPLLLTSAAAEAQDDRCLCRDLAVRCQVRPSSTVLVGEPFEFCAVVTSEGNHVLEDVAVRMRLCDGMVVLDGRPEITIPRLEPGETQTHCIRVMAGMVGPCRLTAHGVDDTGIAASGCYCDVVVEGLPALQLQMVDLDAAGNPQGVFRVGERVVYQLLVEEDQGSAGSSGLRVDFELPPQLRFVSGTGPRGTTVTGEGGTARSSVFNLMPKDVLEFRFVCEVTDVAPRNLVQAKAWVRTADGDQTLASETESTTIRR